MFSLPFAVFLITGKQYFDSKKDIKNDMIFCRKILDQIGEVVIKRGMMLKYNYAKEMLGESDIVAKEMFQEFDHLTVQQKQQFLTMILDHDGM